MKPAFHEGWEDDAFPLPFVRHLLRAELDKLLQFLVHRRFVIELHKTATLCDKLVVELPLRNRVLTRPVGRLAVRVFEELVHETHLCAAGAQHIDPFKLLCVFAWKGGHEIR